MSVTRRQFGPAAASLAAVAAAAPAFGQQTSEVVRWRLTSSFPKSLDTLFGASQTIARVVGEMTDGKFTIMPYGAGELVPGLQVLDAVANGTVECGHTYTGYYIGKNPSFVFDGSVPFGMSTSKGHPMAPWIAADDQGGLLLTAQIAAALMALGVSDPWLDKASAYCWQEIDKLEKTHPYERRAAVMFLDEAGDRKRAELAAEKLKHVQTDGYEDDEGMAPHHYAEKPTSLARSWFTDDEFGKDLDELQNGQQEDGGWNFGFPAFTPVTHCEWRSIATIDALLTLKRYGRIS